jgi:ribosome-binding ATPase YchF (GTP1/OBG family)
MEKNYAGREELLAYIEEHGLEMVEVSAEIEKEIAELDPEEKELFMQELGLEETGIVRIAKSVYSSLGLISFLTCGEDEVKAWTIKKGTLARAAAGKIHSDIERGFIRAEVIKYQDFEQLGSINAVKEKGLFRLEGKEYLVEDGDLINFRFNV